MFSSRPTSTWKELPLVKCSQSLQLLGTINRFTLQSVLKDLRRSVGQKMEKPPKATGGLVWIGLGFLGFTVYGLGFLGFRV
jgi:hypothetical protein